VAFFVREPLWRLQRWHFHCARDTFALALAGVAAGVLLALWSASCVKMLLYDVKPGDPWVLGSSAALLLHVAALAGYLPARRASRIYPMIALRCD